MSDAIAAYNDAKQKLDVAATQVEEFIATLGRWHDTLAKHWKRTVISNTNGAYPMELTMRDDHKSLNVSALPKVRTSTKLWLLGITRNVSLLLLTARFRTRSGSRFQNPPDVLDVRSNRYEVAGCVAEPEVRDFAGQLLRQRGGQVQQ
jgi:hypothetical protein